MKRSFLLSAAVPLFFTQAQAIVTPNPMLSHNDCMGWAYDVDPSIATPAQTRCYALADCMQNQSTDKESLVECQHIAEADFEKSIGKLAYPGKMPEDYVVEPVVTEEADSTLYDIQPGKGWKNSRVGD